MVKARILLPQIKIKDDFALMSLTANQGLPIWNVSGNGQNVESSKKQKTDIDKKGFSALIKVFRDCKAIDF